MPTGIDHVVILVEDLDRAVEQYRKLGFNVTPGGRHARFTHNALITFQDGSYIELIAFYEPPNESAGESHRWFKRLETGGGIIDFALGAPGLDALIADADARGIATNPVSPGARKRPDNQQLEWKMLTMKGDNTGALPFLIEDVTDRSLRVPADASEHENMVRGIRSLVVAVQDVEAASKRYAALLDREAPSGDGLPNLDNAEGVYYMVGAHRIDLAAPTGPGDLKDYLAKRGDSPYELSLLSRDTRDFDPRDTGGARIRLVAG
jgi:catechol 2,3-dioxygenase-like lactoylglutathione lyase family enzyme